MSFEKYTQLYNGGERGITLRPHGKKAEFSFTLSPDYNKSYRLFTVGETEQFYMWKDEPDGPFMYHENGKLRMMWSSFNEGRYVVLIAESDSIKGKWTHLGSQYDFCGGHGMIFTDLDGNRMISLHSPNEADFERAKFFDF